MPENDGTVRITLKDVYQQTQSLEKTFGDRTVQLERSLSDSMNSLNLTMQDIRLHIDTQDKRNASDDQLHSDYSRRLSSLEGVVQQVQPVSSHAEYDNRLQSLERFKYVLIGAMIALQAVVGLAEYLLLHITFK
jgi:hypothetical protein